MINAKGNSQIILDEYLAYGKLSPAVTNELIKIPIIINTKNNKFIEFILDFIELLVK